MEGSLLAFDMLSRHNLTRSLRIVYKPSIIKPLQLAVELKKHKTELIARLPFPVPFTKD